MREDLRIYVEDVVENIDSLNGYNLTNYLMDEVLRVDSYELDEDNTLDISSYTDKLEFLKAIYENIKRPEDQQLFIREVLENEKNLDYRIIEEFRSLVEVPEELEEMEEELEEEYELEEPNNENYDDSYDSVEKEEEKEEKIEKQLEGPAITAYKKETEELERELEELRAKLNGINNLEEEPKEMDEIINNTSYPEIENLSNEIESTKKEIENLSTSINDKTQEKEKYEK